MSAKLSRLQKQKISLILIKCSSLQKSVVRYFIIDKTEACVTMYSRTCGTEFLELYLLQYACMLVGSLDADKYGKTGFRRMVMLKIAICDDERVFLDETAKYCERYFNDKNIEYEMVKYSEGRKLLAADAYDVVLLDVEMHDMNGIEVKSYIERQRSNTRIVFVSSYPEAMPDAFGDNVSGFLVKPLVYEKLCGKLDEVLSKIMLGNRFIMCNTGEECVKVYVKDILYIEAKGRYTEIHKVDGDRLRLVSKSIGDYEKEGYEELVRCHKSYIVNLEYVRSVKGEVKLENGVEIPLGRTLKENMKAEFDRYILRRG